jgi:hypothetical protein
VHITKGNMEDKAEKTGGPTQEKDAKWLEKYLYVYIIF